MIDSTLRYLRNRSSSPRRSAASGAVPAISVSTWPEVFDAMLSRKLTTSGKTSSPIARETSGISWM